MLLRHTVLVYKNTVEYFCKTNIMLDKLFKSFLSTQRHKGNGYSGSDKLDSSCLHQQHSSLILIATKRPTTRRSRRRIGFKRFSGSRD
jgi:hypothetical protein